MFSLEYDTTVERGTAGWTPRVTPIGTCRNNQEAFWFRARRNRLFEGKKGLIE